MCSRKSPANLAKQEALAVLNRPSGPVQHIKQLEDSMQHTDAQPELVEMLRHVLVPAQQEPKEKRATPYKVSEVAEALNVNVSTIYRDIDSGKLPALRVGAGRGTYRVEVDDFDTYRANLKNTSSARRDSAI